MKTLFKGVVLLALLLPLLLVFSCHKAEDSITVEGTILKYDYVEHHYGTHILQCTNKTFAIESGHIELDDFVDQRVMIVGLFKEGYPLDDGPELIEVFTVIY